MHDCTRMETTKGYNHCATKTEYCTIKFLRYPGSSLQKKCNPFLFFDRHSSRLVVKYFTTPWSERCMSDRQLVHLTHLQPQNNWHLDEKGPQKNLMLVCVAQTVVNQHATGRAPAGEYSRKMTLGDHTHSAVPPQPTRASTHSCRVPHSGRTRVRHPV